jgi:hypothetical protein
LGITISHARASTPPRLQLFFAPQLMASPQRKLVAVCGATGAQGGSVVDALLERGADTFAVRGLARSTSSPKAQALAQRGVEVVAANYDDAATLQKAFQGALSAFLVTDFWHATLRCACAPRCICMRCARARALRLAAHELCSSALSSHTQHTAAADVVNG